MNMTRKISTFSLLLLIINGTIGSAWLFAPYFGAQIAGSGVFVSWLIGGFMTIAIALCFAECSVKIPLAGGTTEVARATHGESMAFLVSWIAWISSITVPAIEVQAVLQYAANYFPSLIEKHNGSEILSSTGILSAITLMILLVAINYYGIKSVVRSNFLILFFKLLVIFLAIFAISATHFNPANFLTPNSDNALDTWKNILTALASGGIIFAFVGFKHGVELAGETETPRRALPIAIVGSVVACLLIYLGLQISLIGSLSTQSLAQGWKHLSFTGDTGPFAGIAAGLGMIWLVKLLMADAVVSPLGAGSVYVSSTARISYAMAVNHYFPSFLTKLNRYNIPGFAILFNSFIGCLLFLPFPSWQKMVGFLTSIMVVSYIMGPIAAMSLKKSKAFRSGGFIPLTYLFTLSAFYFCNLCVYWSGWDTVSKLGIAVLVGAIFFFAFHAFSRKHRNLALSSSYWFFAYILGISIISCLGSFGGKNIISFGYDFLIIAVFSMLIFMWAVRSSVCIELINPESADLTANKAEGF